MKVHIEHAGDHPAQIIDLNSEKERNEYVSTLPELIAKHGFDFATVSNSDEQRTYTDAQQFIEELSDSSVD